MTTAEVTWKKDAIKKEMAANNKFLEWAILAIYAFQTAVEQSSEQTLEDNGVGFNGRDANYGSSLAEQIKQSRRAEGFRLSDKQAAAARRMMPKYAGQLAKHCSPPDTFGGSVETTQPKGQLLWSQKEHIRTVWSAYSDDVYELVPFTCEADLTNEELHNRLAAAVYKKMPSSHYGGQGTSTTVSEVHRETPTSGKVIIMTYNGIGD